MTNTMDLITQFKTSGATLLAQTLKTPEIRNVSRLCLPKAVLDDITKLLVTDHNDQPIAVILSSPETFPDLVSKYMERTRIAQKALPSELAHIVLVPIMEGKFGDISYAVLPYHQPFSNRKLHWYLQRIRYSQDLLRLLLQMTTLTCTQVNHGEIETNFMVPLHYFSELAAIPRPLRDLSREALTQLQHGTWQPYHVLMHSDLWKGNILLNKQRTGDLQQEGDRFLLIDWSGSMVKGYAIYDLIRLSQSLGSPPNQLLKQLEAHCRVLDCHLGETRFHLVAALSYLSMNLNHFPLERFVVLAQNCVEKLEKIVGV